MKLSRRVWLIVEAVILVAALVSLYVVYSRQAGERQELNDSLAAAEARLLVLADSREAAEDQLAHAQAALDASQADFPESVESIEYDDDLFSLADDCNVQITSLTASPPTSKTVGGIAYSVSSFVVVISGAVDDILNFMNALITPNGFQLPWTAEVASVNMDVTGSATINLSIYGYRG